MKIHGWLKHKKMTLEERLLERLIRQDQKEDRSRKSSVERLLESVMKHLKKILETRSGTVLIAPDYGTSEFSNLPGSFVSPETEYIQETIKNTIEKYEPRLKDVKVTFEGSSESDLTILFSLTAIIHHLEQVIPVKLRTSMSPNHTFNIDQIK